MPALRIAAFFVCLVMAAKTAAAANPVFESGPTRVHLLELFTSEGCSSCPPAEAWFTKLKENPGLWHEFVPVAFHIDYWDRLGWRDRFSSREWSARQQSYADLWRAESVYTPAFVLDGNESTRSLPGKSPDPIGTLRVSVNGNEARATFKPAKAEHSGNYDVYFSVLGCKLSSNVGAGENKGRNLAHDFVVLSLKKATASPENGEARFAIDKSRAEPNSSLAIAAWITEANNPKPIQATGGWLL